MAREVYHGQDQAGEVYHGQDQAGEVYHGQTSQYAGPRQCTMRPTPRAPPTTASSTSKQVDILEIKIQKLEQLVR